MKHALSRNAKSTPPSIDWQKMEAGYFRDTNDSMPGYEWFHMVATELVNILVLNGVTPGEDLNQIGTLIKSIKDLYPQISNSLADHDIRLQRAYPIGGILFWPDSTNPAGFTVADGRTAPRTGQGSFPSVTEAIEAGKISPVSMASWSSTPGRFGLDANTVRFPDFRSQVLKAFHENSSVRATEWTSALGRYQEDQIQDHVHGYNDIYYSENLQGAPQQNVGGSNATDFDNEFWGADRSTYGVSTGGWWRTGDETRVKNMSVRILVRVY